MLYDLERHHGSFEILLVLHQLGPSTVSRLRKILRPGQEALESSLSTLSGIGLVRCEPKGRFPFSKTYWLTGRGRALAEAPLCSWPSVVNRL